MVNGIRTSERRELNMGHGLKLHVGSRVRLETFKKYRESHSSKRCKYNDKNEDISLKTLNDKNHQIRLRNSDNYMKSWRKIQQQYKNRFY